MKCWLIESPGRGAMPTVWLSFADGRAFEADASKAVKFSDEASAVAMRNLIDPKRELNVTEHVFDSPGSQRPAQGLPWAKELFKRRGK